MWYCIVEAAAMGLELTPARGKDICRLGEMVKIACQEQYPVNHPEFDYPVRPQQLWLERDPAGVMREA